MTEKAARFVVPAAIRPWLVPAAIACLTAVLEIGGEQLRLALRFEREGLAHGEIWRLLTGHFVHLGPSHMGMNALALGVLAFVFAPVLKSRDWLLAALGAVTAIDAGLWFAQPTVAWYVGLSGMLHGFWAAACLRAFALGRREAIALSLLLLAKLGYELLLGPVPLTGTIAAGPVVTSAHAWGALGGAVSTLGGFATRSRERPL